MAPCWYSSISVAPPPRGAHATDTPATVSLACYGGLPGRGLCDRPRKPDREDRAAWGCVCRVDRATLVSEQAGCDGESEACSVDVAVAGGAGCQLEQGKEVGRDAGTVVDDADEGMAGIFAAGDVNCASARRVTQRVVEDMGECAFEAVAVDRHRGAGVSRHLEPDSTLVGGELERGGRVGDRLCEVCGLQPGSLVDVRPRVVEQAGDEPIDLLGPRPRSVEPLTGGADACFDC